MYWLHHLKLFQRRQLHFSPRTSAFHLGIISELTHIHYPECITCLFPLPETLALQPMVRAGKHSVLPHLVTRTHPYFILRLHSVYSPLPPNIQLLLEAEVKYIKSCQIYLSMAQVKKWFHSSYTHHTSKLCHSPDLPPPSTRCGKVLGFLPRKHPCASDKFGFLSMLIEVACKD